MSQVARHTVSNINAVSITLDAGGEQVLFILLAADHSINRLGTGTVNNSHRDLFIGVAHEPLFDRLMTHLHDEMLEHMGGYEIPAQLGLPCKLTIALSFAEGDAGGFGFRYGSKSTGPPIEIMELVRAAVALTDPWFHEQQRKIGKATGIERKPWWKFW